MHSSLNICMLMSLLFHVQSDVVVEEEASMPGNYFALRSLLLSFQNSKGAW